MSESAIQRFIREQENKKKLKAALLWAGMRHRIGFVSYRMLAEWLDVYEGIPAVQQSLNKELAEALVRYINPASSSAFFHLGECARLLETCASPDTQKRILDYVSRTNQSD